MEKSKDMIVDLTTGSVAKKLLRFAFPFMLSTLLQTLYSTVDMIVVGQYVGSAGLSAVSISGQLMFLTMAVCLGLTTAGQILISQQVGLGDRTALKKTIGTLCFGIFAVALLISAAGLLFHVPLLRLLDTPAESWDGAVQYMVIVFAGTIFTYGYNMVSAIFRGMGDSRHPFIFVAIAAGTNLTLDFLFVAAFHWGVAGAALATIIGQAVSFFCSVIYLYRHQDSFAFDFRLSNFRPERHTLSILVKLGIPLALQHSAISISMLFVNKFINQYGVAASATFGTGTKIEQIPWIIVDGIMLASSSMIAQNMGAGKVDRAKKVVYLGTGICAGAAALFIVLFHFYPVQVFRLFTSDASVLELAPMFMFALTLSIPATCIMCPYTAFIQGIGNGMLTLVIALLDGFVTRIFLSLFLSRVCNLELMGLFLGYGLAAYVNLILGAVYFYSGIWKKRKMLV